MRQLEGENKQLQETADENRAKAIRAQDEFHCEVAARRQEVLAWHLFASDSIVHTWARSDPEGGVTEPGGGRVYIFGGGRGCFSQNGLKEVVQIPFFYYTFSVEGVFSLPPPLKALGGGGVTPLPLPTYTHLCDSYNIAHSAYSVRGFPYRLIGGCSVKHDAIEIDFY